MLQSAPTPRSAYAALRPLASRLFAIPVIGYVLRILVGILKLPRFNMHLRRLDEQLRLQAGQQVGQAEPLADEERRRLEERIQRVESAVKEFPRVIEAVTATQTALRARQRSDQAAPATVADRPWIDPQIEVVAETQLRRETPRTFNRLPRLSDWALHGPLSRRMAELHEPHVVHRKMWEYAICLEGLESMGVVSPTAQAIAIGAGSERPLYYYANTIRRMVATDLYDNPGHEGKPAMLADPGQFAPFPYRRDSLEVLRMGGDALDFPDNHFDFAFCLSSIEHFGTRETQRKALDEMGRVVRPGGAVCIITELILNGERHPEYFTPAELQEMFLEHPTLRLEGPPPELRISELLLACPIDVRQETDLAVSPHLVLTDGRVLWTSVSLFFRKIA